MKVSWMKAVSWLNTLRWTLALAMVCGVASAATPETFSPLAAWSAAVASGNAAALQRLYTSNPAPQLYVGRSKPISLQEEVQFWTSLSGRGISGVNPKLLSVSRQGAQTILALRIAASQTGGGSLVASAQQVWIEQGGQWRLGAEQRSDLVPDAGRRLPEPAKPNPSLYPEPAEAPAELTAALAKARKENKRVLAVFGANWCYDCHVLDTTFRSKAFAPLVDPNYVVIHINIGDEGKDNHEMASRLGVSLDRGIPSLAILAADGSVLVGQQNGEFESTVKIGPEDVRAFLEKWKPRH